MNYFWDFMNVDFENDADEWVNDFRFFFISWMNESRVLGLWILVSLVEDEEGVKMKLLDFFFFIQIYFN